MKVWLVWTGEYSSATVVGIYSTLALAEAAAKLYPDGWIDGDEAGYELDGDSDHVATGLRRWLVLMDLDTGDVLAVRHESIGTREPVEQEVAPPFAQQPTGEQQRTLFKIRCDARDVDHAVKIAADARAAYLALATHR